MSRHVSSSPAKPIPVVQEKREPIPKALEQFDFSHYPQGPTLTLEKVAQSKRASDSSQAIQACEYQVEFEIDFIEFSGDGLMIAFCGGWSDIHICRLKWARAGTDSQAQTKVGIEPLVHLPTTTLKVGGFSWGPTKSVSFYPQLVSWDDDSVALWHIDDDAGEFQQVYDYPVEDVVCAAMSSDLGFREVLIWTLTELFIVVNVFRLANQPFNNSLR